MAPVGSIFRERRWSFAVTALRGRKVVIFPPQDEDGGAVLSFEFQKIRYVFDWDRKLFSPVAFPVDQPMGYFQAWRGYQEEPELRAAEKRYGTNRAEMVVPDFLELFKERATAPFFVFQVKPALTWSRSL